MKKTFLLFIGGGLVVTDEKIKQAPEKIAKVLRASLKELVFFLNRREQAIPHLINILTLKDRQVAAAVSDAITKVTARNGVLEDKIPQGLIEDMKKTTGVRREIRVSDIFDFLFVRQADEDLKARGWKP